jgi:hypothetical protein
LKELLTSEPILNTVDLEEDIVVCIKSCKEGLGVVLTQNGHVICCGSRKLKDMKETMPHMNWSLHILFTP